MNDVTDHPALGPLLASWELSLESENKSPRTIGNYLEGLDLFGRWLGDRHPGIEDAGDITTEICREWITHLLNTRSTSTARTRWAAMRQFWGWAYAEQEIEFNPMELVKQPTVTEEPAIEVLTPEQIGELLATCSGQSFLERRDTAIITLFLDTGTRASALASAQLVDLDMRGRTVEVLEKGRKVIVKPFGLTAAKALDRYLRARARSPYAGRSTAIFISARDGRPMNRNSVLQMLRRRGREAGIEGLHPHVFRHTFSDRWLRAGGGEGDLMELNGWSSRDMLGRYARATRAERAREAHRRLSPMDNLDG